MIHLKSVPINGRFKIPGINRTGVVLEKGIGSVLVKYDPYDDDVISERITRISLNTSVMRIK